MTSTHATITRPFDVYTHSSKYDASQPAPQPNDHAERLDANLHSHEETNSLGYMKVILVKDITILHIDKDGKRGGTSSRNCVEMSVGFMIERYGHINAAGYYATLPPPRKRDGDAMITPLEHRKWTLHPSLADAFEVLLGRIKEMEKDGWKVVDKCSSKQVNYDFTRSRL